MWNKEALHLFCSLQVRCKFSKCFKISLHSSRRSHWYASRALHSILQHFETKTSRAALHYLTRRQLWAPSLFESLWIVSYLCVCVFKRKEERLISSEKSSKVSAECLLCHDSAMITSHALFMMLFWPRPCDFHLYSAQNPLEFLLFVVRTTADNGSIKHGNIKFQQSCTTTSAAHADWS